MRALIALTLAALLSIASAVHAQSVGGGSRGPEQVDWNAVASALLGHSYWRQRPIPVSVEHTGNDPVGKQFAYAVREELRASKGFRLVSTSGESYLHINIVTAGILFQNSSRGRASAAAVVFSMRNLVPFKQGDPQTWYPVLLSSQVMTHSETDAASHARLVVASLDESYEDYLRIEREAKAKSK